MLATAKICLTSQISTESGNALAEAYYYLGEIYLDQNKADSASYAFQKSSEADPEYAYAWVGQGRLALVKNNKSEAEDLFSKASKADKKDSNIPVQIALAYGKSKMFTEANIQLEKARKINKNNPRIYVAEGDIILMQDPTKAGDAAGKYENAIYFDSQCKEAYVKAARVFRTINIDVSLAKIEEVLKIDPDYTPAYLEMGETYYANGMYSKSASGYKRYMEAPGVPEEYQNKYASSLFVGKDFMGVLEQARKTLAKNPKNIHMLRLEMFTQYELKNNEAALNAAQRFFATAKPEEAAWQDYRYYGLILKAAGQDQQAITSFEQAIEKEPGQAELYKELASAYENKEDYAKAIPNYEKYLETATSLTLSDYLSFGKCYYMLGNSVPVDQLDLKNSYFQKADSLFVKIIENAPDLYQGYWWRARANAAMDPETKTGLAKPFYEQTLEKIEASKSDPTSVKLEAYNYLGYYYYLQYDAAVRAKQSKTDIEDSRVAAIGYWEKVLQLDPENLGAKQALGVLKK
jgi:tetratricopeptide (TPR) repeat protein